MTEYSGRSRWAFVIVAAGVALLAGVVAYNAGLSEGAAHAAALRGMPAAPYPYYWHRPWGFGFGFPIFFLFLLFFFVLRGAWWGWGGPWRRRWYYDGPHAQSSPGEDRFDAWHRRAHERMKEAPPADDSRRG